MTKRAATTRFRVMACLFLSFLALHAGSGSGQQISPIASNSNLPRQAPLPHLYWHLLMWQNHLDTAATEHEKAGKDGSWLRAHLQKQLGFSDAEFAPVRESSQHLASTLSGLETQAKSLVKEDLALYASGKLTSSDPPPNLAKVKQLQQEREAAIDSEITKLNATLGAKNASRLKTYVTGSFSSRVTATSNPNPPKHQPAYGPSRQALGLEMQP